MLTRCWDNIRCQYGKGLSVNSDLKFTNSSNAGNLIPNLIALHFSHMCINKSTQSKLHKQVGFGEKDFNL